MFGIKKIEQWGIALSKRKFAPAKVTLVYHEYTESSTLQDGI